MKNIVILLLLMMLPAACMEEIIRFEDPRADFIFPADTIELYDNVKFTNTGTGEYFSFWTGDQGHDYNLRDSAKNNIGLPPNAGRDFFYSYTQSGAYTVVMVASSYNETTGKFASDIKSQTVFVKPGNDGNTIEMFAIYNVEKDYTPEAAIIGDSILLFRLNRKYEPRVNTRPVRFRTNYVKAVLTTGNGDTLYSDLSKIPMYDIEADKPNVNLVNVYGYFNKKKVYKLIAAFYPQINSFKFTDGPLARNLLEKPDQPGAYTADIFRDIFLPKTTTIEYDTDSGVVVTMDDDPAPIEPGVTPVTLSSDRHTFYFTKDVEGYKIITRMVLSIIYI
ncbi:MAG: hypothetical protein JXB19_07155 [Bacteroidales bacterium]|nr:hypothetical protein [Bacteroidales bacterium]